MIAWYSRARSSFNNWTISWRVIFSCSVKNSVLIFVSLQGSGSAADAFGPRRGSKETSQKPAQLQLGSFAQRAIMTPGSRITRRIEAFQEQDELAVVGGFHQVRVGAQFIGGQNVRRQIGAGQY